MYLNNLSAMWNRFYAATGDPAAVGSAVRYSRQALQSCADDDPDRPMYANNAALAMLHLAELTGSRPALEAAVAMSRYAADITPADYPDRISHQVNLGAALARAAARSGETATLDAAVEALESAMRITPPVHQAYGGLVLTLGETLLSRSRRTGGDDSMAARGRDLIRQSADVAHLRTETSIVAARRWGDEAAGLGDWKTAASALRRAVQRLAELPAHRLDRIQHEHLLVRLDGLATDTAAACCADGDSPGAIESLELGRGVLLAKTLRDDRTLAALQLRDPALATRIADTQAALSAGPPLPRSRPGSSAPAGPYLNGSTGSGGSALPASRVSRSSRIRVSRPARSGCRSPRRVRSERSSRSWVQATPRVPSSSSTAWGADCAVRAAAAASPASPCHSASTRCRSRASMPCHATCGSRPAA